MTLRHDDIMTWRPDCMRACQSMSRWWAVCGSKAGRHRGSILFFFGKLQRILFKSPPPSRRILTKVFTKTFTKLSLTFTKLSPQGPKRGEKVDFFPQNFLQLSPDPQKFVGHERIPYLCTVSWDQRGPLAVLVFYSPHSAVLPPAPASWQSNRSITIGREKARRKTKKRTMRISHSQGLTVVRLLHESDVCFHINHH